MDSHADDDEFTGYSSSRLNQSSMILGRLDALQQDANLMLRSHTTSLTLKSSRDVQLDMKSGDVFEADLRFLSLLRLLGRAQQARGFDELQETLRQDLPRTIDITALHLFVLSSEAVYGPSSPECTFPRHSTLPEVLQHAIASGKKVSYLQAPETISSFFSEIGEPGMAAMSVCVAIVPLEGLNGCVGCLALIARRLSDESALAQVFPQDQEDLAVTLSNNLAEIVNSLCERSSFIDRLSSASITREEQLLKLRQVRAQRHQMRHEQLAARRWTKLVTALDGTSSRGLLDVFGLAELFAPVVLAASPAGDDGVENTTHSTPNSSGLHMAASTLYLTHHVLPHTLLEGSPSTFASDLEAAAATADSSEGTGIETGDMDVHTVRTVMMLRTLLHGIVLHGKAGRGKVSHGRAGIGARGAALARDSRSGSRGGKATEESKARSDDDTDEGVGSDHGEPTRAEGSGEGASVPAGGSVYGINPEELEAILGSALNSLEGTSPHTILRNWDALRQALLAAVGQQGDERAERGIAWTLSRSSRHYRPILQLPARASVPAGTGHTENEGGPVSRRMGGTTVGSDPLQLGDLDARSGRDGWAVGGDGWAVGRDGWAVGGGHVGQAGGMGRRVSSHADGGETAEVDDDSMGVEEGYASDQEVLELGRWFSEDLLASSQSRAGRSRSADRFPSWGRRVRSHSSNASSSSSSPGSGRDGAASGDLDSASESSTDHALGQTLRRRTDRRSRFSASSHRRGRSQSSAGRDRASMQVVSRGMRLCRGHPGMLGKGTAYVRDRQHFKACPPAVVSCRVHKPHQSALAHAFHATAPLLRGRGDSDANHVSSDDHKMSSHFAAEAVQSSGATHTLYIPLYGTLPHMGAHLDSWASTQAPASKLPASTHRHRSGVMLGVFAVHLPRPPIPSEHRLAMQFGRLIAGAVTAACVSTRAVSAGLMGLLRTQRCFHENAMLRRSLNGALRMAAGDRMAVMQGHHMTMPPLSPTASGSGSGIAIDTDPLAHLRAGWHQPADGAVPHMTIPGPTSELNLQRPVPVAGGPFSDLPPPYPLVTATADPNQAGGPVRPDPHHPSSPRGLQGRGGTASQRRTGSPRSASPSSPRMASSSSPRRPFRSLSPSRSMGAPASVTGSPRRRTHTDDRSTAWSAEGESLDLKHSTASHRHQSPHLRLQLPHGGIPGGASSAGAPTPRSTRAAWTPRRTGRLVASALVPAAADGVDAAEAGELYGAGGDEIPERSTVLYRVDQCERRQEELLHWVQKQIASVLSASEASASMAKVEDRGYGVIGQRLQLTASHVLFPAISKLSVLFPDRCIVVRYTCLEAVAGTGRATPATALPQATAGGHVEIGLSADSTDMQAELTRSNPTGVTWGLHGLHPSLGTEVRDEVLAAVDRAEGLTGGSPVSSLVVLSVGMWIANGFRESDGTVATGSTVHTYSIVQASGYTTGGSTPLSRPVSSRSADGRKSVHFSGDKGRGGSSSSRASGGDTDASGRVQGIATPRALQEAMLTVPQHAVFLTLARNLRGSLQHVLDSLSHLYAQYHLLQHLAMHTVQAQIQERSMAWSSSLAAVATKPQLFNALTRAARDLLPAVWASVYLMDTRTRSLALQQVIRDQDGATIHPPALLRELFPQQSNSKSGHLAECVKQGWPTMVTRTISSGRIAIIAIPITRAQDERLLVYAGGRGPGSGASSPARSVTGTAGEAPGSVVGVLQAVCAYEAATAEHLTAVLRSHGVLSADDPSLMVLGANSGAAADTAPVGGEVVGEGSWTSGPEGVLGQPEVTNVRVASMEDLCAVFSGRYSSLVDQDQRAEAHQAESERHSHAVEVAEQRIEELCAALEQCTAEMHQHQQRAAALEAQVTSATTAISAAHGKRERDVRRVTFRQERLAHCLAVLMQTSTRQDLCRRTSEEMHKAVSVTSCTLYLYDAANHVLLIPDDGNSTGRPDGMRRLAADRGIAGAVATQGTPVHVADCSTHPRYDAEVDAPKHKGVGRPRSLVSVPVRDASGSGEVIAVLQMVNKLPDGTPRAGSTPHVHTGASSPAGGSVDGTVEFTEVDVSLAAELSNYVASALAAQSDRDHQHTAVTTAQSRVQELQNAVEAAEQRARAHDEEVKAEQHRLMRRRSTAEGLLEAAASAALGGGGGSGTKYDSMFGAALGHLRKMLDAEGVALFLYDREAQQLRLRVRSEGPTDFEVLKDPSEEDTEPELWVGVGAGITGACAQACQPVLVSDAMHDSRVDPAVDSLALGHGPGARGVRARVRHIVAYPLKLAGTASSNPMSPRRRTTMGSPQRTRPLTVGSEEVLGVVVAVNKLQGEMGSGLVAGGFQSDDTDMLALSARQFVATVSQLRDYEHSQKVQRDMNSMLQQMREQATTDNRSFSSQVRHDRSFIVTARVGPPIVFCLIC